MMMILWSENICTLIWNRQLHIPYMYVNINTADHGSTARKFCEASISCIHSCLSFKMTWVGIVYNCEVHTKALSSVRPFHRYLAWNFPCMRWGIIPRGFWEKVYDNFCCTMLHLFLLSIPLKSEKSQQKLWQLQSWLYFLGGPRATKSLQNPHIDWHTTWVCNSQYPRCAWRNSFTSHQ